VCVRVVIVQCFILLIGRTACAGDCGFQSRVVPFFSVTFIDNPLFKFFATSPCTSAIWMSLCTHEGSVRRRHAKMERGRGRGGLGAQRGGYLSYQYAKILDGVCRLV
jgi:hypothetical protein